MLRYLQGELRNHFREHRQMAFVSGPRQVGQLTSYSYLAKSVRVAVETVRRWIGTLESLYYCFTVKPWHRNVARALRK